MTKQPNDNSKKTHSSHWGAFSGQWVDGKLVITPHPIDPDPNPIIQNFPEALRHKARIAKPMVRRGWLENGPGPDDRRGRDAFVEMEWDEVLDRLAGEMTRIQELRRAGDLWRLLWLVERRALPSCPEPDPPLLQCRLRRLCPFGQQLQRRRLLGDPAACARAIRDLSRRNVTWDQIAEHTDYRSRLRRHAAEELDDRRAAASPAMSSPTPWRAPQARGCAFWCCQPR
jgi:biotin/methionine sulfoxide reductase